MDELDQMLVGLVLQLPQEAKMQLSHALQGQAQEQSVQEQALGQAMRGGY